jgi:hypothetical protein
LFFLFFLSCSPWAEFNVVPNLEMNISTSKRESSGEAVWIRVEDQEEGLPVDQRVQWSSTLLFLFFCSPCFYSLHPLPTSKHMATAVARAGRNSKL